MSEEKPKLFKRRDAIFSIVYGALAATGFVWGLNLDKKVEKVLSESETLSKEIHNELAKMYPIDSLHSSDCPFGRVRGDQNRLMADAIKEISISDGKDVVSSTGGTVAFLGHSGSAAPIIEKYLEGVPADSFRTRNYQLKIVSTKSLNNVDIIVEAPGNRKIYVKGPSESDKTAGNMFEFNANFPMTCETPGIEELFVKIIEKDKNHPQYKFDGVHYGDPARATAALFRVPVVVNARDSTLYLAGFFPQGMTIADLQGKPITKPFSVTLYLDGISLQETYHVQNPGGKPAVTVPLKLQEMVAEASKNRISKFTPAHITISHYSDAGVLSKTISRFTRELMIAPKGADLTRLIDPYDSDKNSSYQCFEEGRDKYLVEYKPSIFPDINIIRGMHEGDTIVQEVYETSSYKPVSFKVKGINTNAPAVDLVITKQDESGKSFEINLRGKERKYLEDSMHCGISIEASGKDDSGKQYVDLRIR